MTWLACVFHARFFPLPCLLVDWQVRHPVTSSCCTTPDSNLLLSLGFKATSGLHQIIASVCWSLVLHILPFLGFFYPWPKPVFLTVIFAWWFWIPLLCQPSFCSTIWVLLLLLPTCPCTNPDCTSAVPNTACVYWPLLPDFLTPDFRPVPACTFARIFWTFLFDFFSCVACAWPELPLLFELLLNILTIILLLSLLLGPQSFTTSPVLTLYAAAYFFL